MLPLQRPHSLYIDFAHYATLTSRQTDTRTPCRWRDFDFVVKREVLRLYGKVVMTILTVFCLRFHIFLLMPKAQHLVPTLRLLPVDNTAHNTQSLVCRARMRFQILFYMAHRHVCEQQCFDRHCLRNEFRHIGIFSKAAGDSASLFFLYIGIPSTCAAMVICLNDKNQVLSE